MQQGAATRTAQASLSAALAAATANASARVPAEQSGGTLAELAQRDLDATLQLLADRAQYITGSTGVAIALRRSGKNDMLCRASTGSNAPELGALLSAEFGLSGESVRTRQVLRCDDIERDERVNREVCRQLGISSVAVMPVVNDDEVFGVFELFSGKVNAFGERDLIALKRLSEMVETAVKLSRAAEQVPESVLETASVDRPVAPTASGPAGAKAPAENLAIALEAEFVADAVLPQEPGAVSPAAEVPSQPQAGQNQTTSITSGNRTAEPFAQKPVLQAPAAETLNRPLLWSMALDPMATAAPTQAGQDEVPATLRNLRKCEVCGFPVSPGRTFCVECEEKKWRGQLKTPRTSAVQRGASSTAAAAAPAPAQQPPDRVAYKSSQPANQAQAPKSISTVPVPAARSSTVSRPAAESASRPPAAEPELILSAALPPSQSWVAAHKFVILTLLVLGAGAAFLLLR